MKRLSAVAMAIGWPSFLMAGVLEILVFAFVDPRQLHGLGGDPLDLNPTVVYSLAFFVFWVVIALAGAISQLLTATPFEINSRSYRR